MCCFAMTLPPPLPPLPPPPLSIPKPVKMQGADSAAAASSTLGDAAAASQAVRGLNEDWDKYDCGIREADFDSLKCQNVLAAMRKCGMDTSEVERPTKVDLFPPALVKTPPVLIKLADYNQTTSCQFMASMLGACAAGGAVFAASQLGPESGKDSPWMPALAATGAGAGVSALGGLICTSSPPKQVGQRPPVSAAAAAAAVMVMVMVVRRSFVVPLILPAPTFPFSPSGIRQPRGRTLRVGGHLHPEGKH